MTFQELAQQAHRVRAHAIRMATNGGCFLGASLSCADLLVYLYDRVLRVGPERLRDPSRDYLFLSKGHDVPALYGTLAERGYFPIERLARHLSIDDHLYWHPNRAVPGVEFHSGSLGHLISVGMGVALDAKLVGGPSRVFVVVGDGELDEGSVWEAALVASAHKLDNLVVVVDRNGFQANVATEDLVPLEPLDAKFRAFGFEVTEADGHSFPALERAFAELPRAPGRPTAIIARTVRGKGLPSIEGRADRWFVDFSAEEVAMLLAELEGTARAELTSAPLVVR
ncbi:MAG TPA: 1-deoxy-D-xylulose-5-phosphate synthase N-terminal domain-containing protein [Dongiaceae bacterium]|nr:1-deoxy-D-xylulose-5-phosphate synthase N-terminal domain-containing protein [Dongiaceae bacterium]